MAGKVKGRKRNSLEKPLCKYGSSCYRKNREHLAQFRHPPAKDLNQSDTSVRADDPQSSEVTLDDSNTLPLSVDAVESKEADDSPPVLVETEDTPRPPSPTDIEENIKEKFLVEMPADFYDLWEFAKTIHEQDPSEAFAEAGLHLVGPYDVLSKKISNKDIVSDDILCHWRYYYDPPEFQTVIKKDGDDCYHIGYFRDDPSEMPFGLASNSSANGAKLKLVGDNIFCAIYQELFSCIKNIDNKATKNRYIKIQQDLENFAKKQKYSVDVQTAKTKARNKKVVSKTFHGLGIVVPLRGEEIGYRPLSESNASIKKILSVIADRSTNEQKIAAREPLDRILSNVGFANDECDFGMGLELGIDIFCFGDPYFHNDLRFVLCLAYDLLDRPQYARILRAHLKNRRKGDLLSIKAE